MLVEGGDLRRGGVSGGGIQKWMETERGNGRTEVEV